ncbi:MAG: DUF4870 domain-containing protein [Anaerolineae bacterium]|nr:DUF4870 domain-containing protein [Anaerolineae bacterium]
MDQHDPTAEQGNVNNNHPPHDEGDAVPVPFRVRDAIGDMRQRLRDGAPPNDDAVVREYEARYHGNAPDGPSRLEAPPEQGNLPPGRARYAPKPKRMIDPVEVDANERKWAALAHASTLLTALVALLSFGLGALLTMLAPLFIYFAFRKRSEYVAFHALQAFTVQLVGIIGFLAVLILGAIVWVALLLFSALLVLVLIGIVLLPIVALAAGAYFLASLALPLGMVIFSVKALFETRQGHNYRIPYIARWVESQMYSE